MANCSFGSIWRKWDLHVHTPYSILNNQFGNCEAKETWDSYVHSLFTKAINEGIAAIGLTDYFSIKGFLKVKSILGDSNRVSNIFKNEIAKDPYFISKINDILLLPDIEFRSDTVINSNGKDSKYQFHVIFSDEIEPSQIIDSFLSQLSIADSIGHDSAKYSLTDASLIKFGGECLKDIPELKESALYAGYNMCFVNFGKVIEKLRENVLFKDKYLVGATEEDITKINWTGQAGRIRKNIYSLSDFIFSANPKSIAWLASEVCNRTLGSCKPCLWGSDSHSIDDLFKVNLDRRCWIKCDPTFNGLLESTYSFSNRIFIGDEPEELLGSNARKSYTIGEVSISNNGIAPNEKWFNASLQINPFMCTIIGNKGSGKSALTDIISKCCNSKTMEYASFLKPDRFNKKTTNYGSHYKAHVGFADGRSQDIGSLDLPNDISQIEYVEYLPQNYIEKVCNDIDNSFQDEVDKVIFSFISPSDRLGSNNLQELIGKKTETIDELEEIKASEISKINSEIISLEKKSTQSYFASVKNRLELEKQRRTNHLSNKPKEVARPDDIETDKNAQKIFELSQKIIEEEYKQTADLERLGELNSIKLELSVLRKKVSDAKESAANVQNAFKEFKEKHKLSIGLIFEIKEDFSDLNEYIEKLNHETGQLLANTTQTYSQYTHPILTEQDFNKEISALATTSQHKDKIYIYDSFKKIISTKTSETNAAYLKYSDELNKWTKTLNLIDGTIPDDTGEGSIKSCEDELEFLKSQLDTNLRELKKKRHSLIEQLYDCFKEKEKVLFNLYKPIQDKIDSLLKTNSERISFEVKITIDDSFGSSLFGMINASLASKYRGTAEGKKYVDDTINKTDFNSKESTLSFVSEHFSSVTESLDKEEQLLKNKISDFYNFLSEFKYLNVKYQLSMGGKSLKELSPGERGIVLLIFYLALGKGHSPLIIDQPEDNLDNQSIFSKLVPCIVEAKKSRQIIVVTHNPNIAIACDSEQVVFSLMSAKGKSISYESGSIENLKIKQHILDVLEGTKVAFDERKLKYEGR